MVKTRIAIALSLTLFALTTAESRGQLSAAAGAVDPWVGTWAVSPMQVETGFGMKPFSDVTLREIVHISIGGPQIRLRFSNEFGADPLLIRNVQVGLSGVGAKVVESSSQPVTFGGDPSVTIPPAAAIYSDPVTMPVAPMADLAVSYYLPAQVIRSETYHALGLQDNFYVAGDMTGGSDLPQGTRITSWYFLTGIDVRAADNSRAIVTLGDSITDGTHSTPNSNQRWPNLLAARLAKVKNLGSVAVLDEGISGNRILNDVAGPNALARLDRDVLAQNGVRYLILLEGINDIGHTALPTTPFDEVTLQQLEFGMRQIANAAHEHGIKAFAATLTPYKGARYYSEKGEQTREALNDWIRTSGTFDAVIDFDKATRAAQDPLTFDARYDSGDHLHPNDAGYAAMAAAIDLNLFAK